MNILIVDDEPDYRMLLKTSLLEKDWTIFLASDGEEGLEKMRDEKIDIVISDIYMPIMDGIKFHQTARRIAEFASIPFLFVSAYDDEYTLAAIKDPKIEAFMRKGKSISLLKEWIRYLTTPENKRPKIPPGHEGRPSSVDPNRGRTRGGTRTHIM